MTQKCITEETWIFHDISVFIYRHDKSFKENQSRFG